MSQVVACPASIVRRAPFFTILFTCTGCLAPRSTVEVSLRGADGLQATSGVRLTGAINQTVDFQLAYVVKQRLWRNAYDAGLPFLYFFL